MDDCVVSDLLLSCFLCYPSLLWINAVLVSSLRGLNKVMQFLVGRMKASVADTTMPVCDPLDTKLEPGAHNAGRHLDPSNAKFSTTFMAALYTAAAMISRSRLLVGLEAV